MSLFKLVFSRRFRQQRRLLFKVRIHWPPTEDRDVLNRLRFFPYLFYTKGFLGGNQIPAFPNAYKNISPDVFRKTYIALPVYSALRSGLDDLGFTSIEQMTDMLSQRFPTLDGDVLCQLSSDWSKANHEELDTLLYQHFKAHGVFHEVFSATDEDIETWFNNFLNQTFDHAVKLRST